MALVNIDLSKINLKVPKLVKSTGLPTITGPSQADSPQPEAPVETVDLGTVVKNLGKDLAELMGILRDQRPAVLTGPIKRLFNNQTLDAVSDDSVDCRRANAVHVDVFVSGATPSTVLTFEGLSEAGANARTLPDANATKTITESASFDIVVGSSWIRARMATTTGTFAAGQGFTVYVTPKIGSGSGSVAASGTYHSASPTLANGQANGLELDVNGNLLVSLATALSSATDSVTARLRNPVTPDTATGSAAIAKSSAVLTTMGWLTQVTCKLSAAPTTAGSITVTLNANAGAAYDILLNSQSMVGVTDYIFQPPVPIRLVAGDVIDVAYANADGRTYGLQIYVEAH